MKTAWAVIGAACGVMVALAIHNLGYYPGWGLIHLGWAIGAIVGWGFGKFLVARDSNG